MANRRRRHVIRKAIITINSAKCSALMLALVACWLTISVVASESFGRLISKPDYRISGSDYDALQQQQQQQQQQQLQSLDNSYYSNSPLSAATNDSPTNTRAKLLSQLIRARLLLDEQLVARQPTEPLPKFNYDLGPNGAGSLSSSPVDNGVIDFGSDDYLRLPAASTSSISGQPSSQLLDELDSDYWNTKYSDSKNRFPVMLSVIDQPDDQITAIESVPNNSDKKDSQLNDNSFVVEGLKIDDEGKADDNDKKNVIGDWVNSNNNNNNNNESNIQVDKVTTRNLTTLLEDEETDVDLNGNSIAANTSAGSLISKGNGAEAFVQPTRLSLASQDNNNNNNATTHVSMLNWMYKRMKSLMPYLNPLSYLSGPAKSGAQLSTGVGSVNKTMPSNSIVEGNSEEKRTQIESNGKNEDNVMNDELNRANTKQRFSDASNDERVNHKTKIVVNKKINSEQNNNDDDDSNNNNNNNNDKQFKIKMMVNKTPKDYIIDDEDARVQPTVDNGQGEGGVAASRGQSVVTIEPKVNLIRQSNLIMPSSSNDDDLLASQTTLPASSDVKTSAVDDSLVGKYIYAPTQHYYLNTAIDGPHKLTMVENDEYTPMVHRSYVKHFQPGDQIFGSYNSMKPLYHKNGLIDGNKTNDIYFLVMVAAFCVMAMAVVLAAGLFAYKVQQNRKSSPETDYPTYGVVGPNNMNGKCGAASFVGGYFAGNGIGPTGPGSSAGSKTGSAKHLPDLYNSNTSSYNSATEKASIGSAGNGSVGGCKKTNVDHANVGRANTFVANQDAARMYHYQHQKQQMIVSDCNSASGRHTSASDLDSEDENDDGSYTVYECPGLASAHEMEIKNPLFNDEPTTP